MTRLEDRDVIHPGTILIEKSLQLPDPLKPGNNISGTAWAAVAGRPAVRQIEDNLAAAGWTFFFMAHAIETTAFGFDRPKAVAKALLRLIALVERKKCNALEIDEIASRSFWGLPYVRLSAHPRHIQKGLAFGSTI